MTIGLGLGWGGILDKIRRYRKVNTDEEAGELYDGLESMVLGFQSWIDRHAREARRIATSLPTRAASMAARSGQECMSAAEFDAVKVHA